MKNSIIELKREELNNISGGILCDELVEWLRMLIIATSPIVGAFIGYKIIKLLSKERIS